MVGCFRSAREAHPRRPVPGDTPPLDSAAAGTLRRSPVLGDGNPYGADIFHAASDGMGDDVHEIHESHETHGRTKTRGRMRPIRSRQGAVLAEIGVAMLCPGAPTTPAPRPSTLGPSTPPHLAELRAERRSLPSTPAGVGRTDGAIPMTRDCFCSRLPGAKTSVGMRAAVRTISGTLAVVTRPPPPLAPLVGRTPPSCRFVPPTIIGVDRTGSAVTVTHACTHSCSGWRIDHEKEMISLL